MNSKFQLKVPDMGEGLKYAKVIRVLKSLGEWIDEDSDVVEIETEKALLCISTPKSGYLSDIFCSEGATVDVGATLVEIDQNFLSHGNSGVQLQKRNITKPYITDIPPPPSAVSLPDQQISLIQHMQFSKNIVIAASIESQIDWEPIDYIKKAFRASKESSKIPSSLAIICWAVSQAMQVFDKFRWKLTHENTVIRSNESLIGIAVSKENDTLETPVVTIQHEDSLLDVIQKIRKSLKPTGEPISGVTNHTLALSDMSSFQTFRATPIVVYPAMATLFIGTPHFVMVSSSTVKKVSNFVLAFDHRLVNGVYAAKFLQHVNSSIHKMAKDVSLPENGKAYFNGEINQG